ncbi:hypothetical protein, partial [Mitsuokella multacida]|uniref:hypothetical protein n=1 Tax=Mitsuokella multacida TaxID=52226 RepID=UPI003F811739
MIHVALFSFQRTTLSFEVLFSNFHLKAIRFKRLLYLIASSGACQEVFSFFFQVLLSFLQIPCQSRLMGFLLWPYRSATCIILQDSGRFVNTYFEKR